MVSPADWSATPNANVTVDGVNIGENCPTGNINNALRAVMAGVRTLHNQVQGLVSTIAGKLSASAAAFTGTQPIYASEGAFLHHASASMTGGRVFVLPEGAADPAGLANGDLIFYYTP